MLKKLSPASRIALGLTGIVAAILSIGLNLMPDVREAKMDGRIRMCEVLAGEGRAYIQRSDLRRWRAVLQLAVNRDEDLMSAGVRSRKGKMLIEVGDHNENWPNLEESSATGEFIHIPILTSNKKNGSAKWGQIELRYTPLGSASPIIGFFTKPFVLLWGIFALLSFLAFRWFLSRVLTQLDPAKAMPKRVRFAYDSLAGGVVVLDNNEKILLANTAFSDFSGVDREALYGKQLSSFEWSHLDGNSGEFPWETAHRTKKAVLGTTLHVKNGDFERIVVVNAAPVIAGDNSYKGLLVGFEDVTQLEEAREKLVASQQEAEAANVAKSEFLANMSHEIRTPMNSILGFADVLRRGFDDDPEQKQEYLNIIHSSGQHLLDLINDILDLSKVESGKVELESVAYEPHRILNDVVNVFRVKCEEKGLGLDFEIDGSIPSTVIGDPTRTRQILTNLTGNAIKFTSEGSVTIRAKYDDATKFFTCDVIDTGIGIDEDKIQKVFEPFSQADTSTTREYGGTGLGLAISRKFSRMMGGDLTATSVVGEGTTFTTSFRAAAAENAKLIDTAQARSLLKKMSHAKGEQLQLPPGNVLLVEDGESNRKLVELILKRAGCVIDSAENGQIGMDMALSGDYDVVLMDMQMPVTVSYTHLTLPTICSV